MGTLASLKSQVMLNEKQVVSVANAADKEVLLSIKKAIEENLCSFILFGDNEKIYDLAKQIDLNLVTPELEVRHITSDIGSEAVKAIEQKEAHILMKGNISTKELLKAVLDKEHGLRTGSVLSHVALFEIPDQHKMYFLTDAAMNITPTLQEKVHIIDNVVKVAHGVGIERPKVAVIAPVEVVNEAMPSTLDAAVLTQMQKRGQIKGCLIDGPLAFDNAVSLEATEHKAIQSDVAGQADILMVPTIDVGNALYKSFIHFANAKVAAIICGARAPIVLTSRADSAESKLYSLTLALLSAKTI